YPGRAGATQVQPRRVPNVFQYSPWGHQPGWPSSYHADASRTIWPITPETAFRQTRPHRILASHGAATDDSRGANQDGHVLHRPLVHLAGPADHRQNVLESASRRGSLLTGGRRMWGAVPRTH